LNGPRLVNSFSCPYNTGVPEPRIEIDLDELVLKYRPVVSFRVRKALGGATPDWEDVADEVITQVIEKVQKGEFRGESSIGTFIYTVTSRRIVDFIREKTKVLRHAPEPSGFPDPREAVESRERAARIEEIVKGLKPKFREVLYLYYYKDLPREDVARELGIPARRVSERVNYALKLIKKSLKKRPDDSIFSGPGRLKG
jgi:RNA polymerase sigma factor (sigma-70 family)